MKEQSRSHTYLAQISANTTKTAINPRTHHTVTFEPVPEFTKADSKTSYTYIVYDPDGTPLYIGAGKGNRANSHHRVCHQPSAIRGSHSPKLITKLADYRANGTLDRCSVHIHHRKTRKAAFREETTLIRAARTAGIPILNGKPGGKPGVSGKWTPERRAAQAERMRDLQRKLANDPAYCAKRSRNGKKQMAKLWKDPNFRKTRSEFLKSQWDNQEFRDKATAAGFNNLIAYLQSVGRV